MRPSNPNPYPNPNPNPNPNPIPNQVREAFLQGALSEADLKAGLVLAVNRQASSTP